MTDTSPDRAGRGLDRELVDGLDRSWVTSAEPTTASLQQLGERVPLSRKDETKVVRAAVDGDPPARAELVQAFLPLIGSVARNYRATQQVSRLELVQEGVVGLLRALERYDPDLGTPFWAYASWWVRQAMQQLVSELTRPVVLSDRALRQLSQVKQAHAELHHSQGREPSVAEVADRTGVEPEQLTNLMAADRPPQALEEPLEAEDGTLGTFGQLIADPLAEDEYERVVSHVTLAELKELLSGLSERERRVLRARFGLDEEVQSLRQIGEQLGLSAERVRQLENRALGKLRAAATVEGA